MTTEPVRIGYADPPYPGCAHMYRNHPDYAGEVDHTELVERLQDEYDGWVLHTHEPGLRVLLPIIPDDARIMAWVKPFASFKPNVPVAYAWEPVIVKAARRPCVDTSNVVMRDWVAANITMRRGLTGVKPDEVCRWAFEVVGAKPGDTLDDMFPGTGAVARAWTAWERELRLPMPQPVDQPSLLDSTEGAA